MNDLDFFLAPGRHDLLYALVFFGNFEFEDFFPPFIQLLLDILFIEFGLGPVMDIDGLKVIWMIQFLNILKQSFLHCFKILIEDSFTSQRSFYKDLVDFLFRIQVAELLLTMHSIIIIFKAINIFY